MAKKTASYRDLYDELETILAELQAPGIQVDEAVKLYEKGLKITAALEVHLAEAENTITKLQVREVGPGAA